MQVYVLEGFHRRAVWQKAGDSFHVPPAYGETLIQKGLVGEIQADGTLRRRRGRPRKGEAEFEVLALPRTPAELPPLAPGGIETRDIAPTDEDDEKDDGGPSAEIITPGAPPSTDPDRGGDYRDRQLTPRPRKQRPGAPN